MYKKLMTTVVVVALLAGTASAALEYSWDFDDGTDMGWTPTGAGSTVKWYGFKDPPDNTISNWGLGMNNAGATEHLKWEIQKEITPGEQYELAFDYTAGGEGAYVTMYFWDSSWSYLGSQVVYDYLVWGSTPSLNLNGGDWTHRDVAVDAAYIDAKYVTTELNFKAYWGQTIFDEIAISVPVLHVEPLLNGQFEVAGPGGSQAANWDMTGNCERNGTAFRSGEYSIKTYDAGGGGGITWSVVSQDIVGLVVPYNTAIRLSAFSKGTDFNGLPGGTEDASIKLILWHNGVVEKEEVLSFNPQSQWHYISVSTDSPSDAIIDKITVQLMYGSDNDGAGVIYWDDVGLTFGGSNLAYAHNPYPIEDTLIPSHLGVNLYWSAGDNADAHDVYLGTVFDDVNDSARMAGDLDGDRHVGLGDLLILSDQWMDANPLLLADIESDGGVTFADFAVLAENWGETSYDTPYQGKQTGTIYAAGNLDCDTTYYWRIDELDQSSGQKPVKGDVWSFTTKEMASATVNVDLNDTQFPFCGIGWNVHAATFQNSNWALVEANLDSMQMQFARIILHPEWWWPEGNQYTPTSSAMNSIYDFLDYCQNNNITVLVHNWWTGGKYDDHNQWPNHYWWLANCCYLDPTNLLNKWEAVGWWGSQGPETDYPYSTDLFGHIIAKIVDYMVNTKGYTCVKYVGIWNEPNGQWAFNPRDMNNDGYPDFVYPDDFYELYDKTHYYLDHYDTLGQVKLVGSDITAAADDSMDDFGNTLSAWSGGQRVDNYLGSMSFHSYSPSYQNVCSNAMAQIQNNDYDSQYEEILVGEMGDQSFDLSTAQGRISNSLDSAKKIVHFSKQGAYAMARWWYNGGDSGWEATSQGEIIVPQNFNPVKLFANSLPNTSTDRYVMATNINSSDSGYFDAVSIKYFDTGGHKNTIWVINDDLEERIITINFDNLSSDAVFEKQYIDFDDEDCPIVSGGVLNATMLNPQFVDVIPSRSLVIYKQH